MISETVGGFAFVLALSFLENFPSHKVKHLRTSEDYSTLTSSCSWDAQGFWESLIQVKTKSQTEKACLPPLGHTCHYHSVTAFIFSNRRNFFPPFHSIIPLFIPKLWIEGRLDARHVLNAAEPGVSKTRHCTYPPNLTG